MGKSSSAQLNGIFNEIDQGPELVLKPP